MADTTTIISEVSSGYIDHAIDWDDTGRGFLVVAHAPDPKDNNKTEAFVCVAEDGLDFNPTPIKTIKPQIKAIEVEMTDKGHDLMITFTTRRGGTGQVLVDTKIELHVLPNVWNVYPDPCVTPDNRPYFHPGALVTRGQMAKIVALATGITAVDPTKQTFEDVPVGSTFHDFVEALAQDSVVGGYACKP